MDQKQQVFRHLEDGILIITVDNPETKTAWIGPVLNNWPIVMRKLTATTLYALGFLRAMTGTFYRGAGEPLQPWGKRTLYQCADPVSSGRGAGAQADDCGCQRPLYESGHGGAGPV